MSSVWADKHKRTLRVFEAAKLAIAGATLSEDGKITCRLPEMNRAQAEAVGAVISATYAIAHGANLDNNFDAEQPSAEEIALRSELLIKTYQTRIVTPDDKAFQVILPMPWIVGGTIQQIQHEMQKVLPAIKRSVLMDPAHSAGIVKSAALDQSKPKEHTPVYGFVTSSPEVANMVCDIMVRLLGARGLEGKKLAATSLQGITMPGGGKGMRGRMYEAGRYPLVLVAREAYDALRKAELAADLPGHS